MFHWNRSVPIKTFSLNWRLSMSIFFFNNLFCLDDLLKVGKFCFYTSNYVVEKLVEC